MAWLALSYALATAHADAQEARSQSLWGTWSTTGRLVDGSWHLGARPVAELDPEGALNWGVGLTIQVSLPVL